MNYTVKYLINHLEEIVNDMKIDNNFKNNPSFKDCLNKIVDLINNIGILDSDKVEVKEDKGYISFNYYTLNSCYHFVLSSVSSSNLNCMLACDKDPYFKNGKLIYKKNIVEENINLFALNTMEFTTYYASCYGIDDEYQSHGDFYEERCYFDGKGIMKRREYREYLDRIIYRSFSKITNFELLYRAKSSYHNRDYNKYIVLNRKYLDVANYYMQDKMEGINYQSDILISNQNSLKDMNIPTSISKRVIIPTLSEDDIVSLLQREKEDIKEGLKDYILDRCNYSYDSTYDNKFIFENKNDLVK